MASGRLVVFRSDRLGARILCLVNALRLSRDYGAPFAVFWQESHDVGENFNDPTTLFSADFVKEHFIDVKEWRRIRPESERVASFVNEGGDALRAALQSGQDVTVDQAFGVLTLAGEDETTVHRACAEIFASLPFAPELTPLMAEIDRQMAGAVAYHVRRGDLTQSTKAMNKAWPHKFVPDEFYLVHMENEIDQGVPVVIFSDDADTLSRFKKRFPGLRSAADLIGKGPFKPGAQDLLELYALSRATRVIAPEKSAFSTTAVDLGSATKTSVTEDLTPPLIEKAHRDLEHRLANDRDSFAGDGEIGQCLAHLAAWHKNAGRGDANIAMLEEQVREGLSISFVFAHLMEEQFSAGDLDGVIETGKLMDQGQVVIAHDFAEAEALRGLALMLKGQRQEGVRHVTNAFWHKPDRRLIAAIVLMLLHKGWLDGTNFFPVDAHLLNLRQVRAPQSGAFHKATEFLELPDVKFLPQAITILWDWGPLLRNNPIAGNSPRNIAISMLEDKGRRRLNDTYAGFISRLYDLPERPHDATAPGTVAETVTGLDLLRRSRLALMDRNRDLAAHYAAEASACDGASGFLAWEGHVAAFRRDWDHAAQCLDAAEARGFSTPHQLYLQSSARNALKDINGALERIRAALALAPLEARYRLIEADLLSSLGRYEEAHKSLRVLIDCGIINPKILEAEIDVLSNLGLTDELKAARKMAQKRYPDRMKQIDPEPGGTRPEKPKPAKVVAEKVKAEKPKGKSKKA